MSRPVLVLIVVIALTAAGLGTLLSVSPSSSEGMLDETVSAVFQHEKQTLPYDRGSRRLKTRYLPERWTFLCEYWRGLLGAYEGLEDVRVSQEGRWRTVRARGRFERATAEVRAVFDTGSGAPVLDDFDIEVPEGIAKMIQPDWDVVAQHGQEAVELLFTLAGSGGLWRYQDREGQERWPPARLQARADAAMEDLGGYLGIEERSRTPTERGRRLVWRILFERGEVLFRSHWVWDQGDGQLIEFSMERKARE